MNHYNAATPDPQIFAQLTPHNRHMRNACGLQATRVRQATRKQRNQRRFEPPMVRVKLSPLMPVRSVTVRRPSARWVMRAGPSLKDPPTPPLEVLMRNGP